jgi:polyribonucleotide nucleotidyltransferase
MSESNNRIEKIELEIGGKKLTIETGRVARQADGAVTVRLADTMILATCVCSKEKKKEREGQKPQDFLPLTVDYREKAYAAGKIPGGFFKREGRPSEKEVLSARLIDRPLRPLFPEGYFNEVQVMVMVLSSDQENDADILGIIGASQALLLSQIPFDQPIGAVRIGRIDQKRVVNPTFSELEESDINLVVAGTEESIIMVEGACQEISEDELLLALELGHQEIKKIIQVERELAQRCGQPKEKVEVVSPDPELLKLTEALTLDKIKEANHTTDKTARQKILDDLYQDTIQKLSERFARPTTDDQTMVGQEKVWSPEKETEVFKILQEIERREMRRMMVETGRRIDGRDDKTVRPISCEIGVLPRTHGSALFTRGQTQCLAVTTLGTKMDEQRIDDLEGESTKSYMLHYNFPPFSVGESRPVRGPGRREIGHGALAERSIQSVIPKEEVFPYTVRIVSDILESNGSSSMATVCGSSLSLMDAGVPIKAPVAGIAMGLIKEHDNTVILTDILGVEDHFGDMDFKVAGTREGITAFQMDIKISGLELELIKRALVQAKDARLYILDVMEKTIAKPRPELSVYAPRIVILKIKVDKIGEVIGPGGKMIRSIIEKSGAKIDIEDDGTIFIATPDQKALEIAQDLIMKLIEEPEINKVYTGKVKRIMPFGAFVEILPGQEGLVHISELDSKRVQNVEDIVKMGDEIPVKVIGIDSDGKIKLSRKACLPHTTMSVRKKLD